jgi:hypothetical protein
VGCSPSWEPTWLPASLVVSRWDLLAAQLGHPSSPQPRSNLAFASIPLEKDFGFDNAVFGLASGLFFASYASLQIPSQLLAVRLGGPNILALLAIGWGVVAASMAGVRSKAGLYAQRVMLGAMGEWAVDMNSARFPVAVDMVQRQLNRAPLESIVSSRCDFDCSRSTCPEQTPEAGALPAMWMVNSQVSV